MSDYRGRSRQNNHSIVREMPSPSGQDSRNATDRYIYNEQLLMRSRRVINQIHDYMDAIDQRDRRHPPVIHDQVPVNRPEPENSQRPETSNLSGVSAHRGQSLHTNQSIIGEMPSPSGQNSRNAATNEQLLMRSRSVVNQIRDFMDRRDQRDRRHPPVIHDQVSVNQPQPENRQRTPVGNHSRDTHSPFIHSQVPENRPQTENNQRRPGGDQREDPPICTICLDNLEEGVGTTQQSCSHNFHTACITRWMQERRFCPVCRTRIPQGDRGGILHP